MPMDKETGAPAYRADIDGLRALAVLSVMAFHAFPEYVQGGFIGVDVFFIISGFLISSIILRSLKNTRFSFADFYGRRVRRIFPALFLVLMATLAAGWFFLLAGPFKQLGRHVAGGAGFIANFLLWSEAGYFDDSADLKPLLHLWSLGVEEQFYFIWPLVLWAAHRLKLNKLAVIIGLGGLSFLVNMIGLRLDAVAVFYFPFTRFFELLMGALWAYGSVFPRASWRDLLRLRKARRTPKILRALKRIFERRKNERAWLGLALFCLGLLSTIRRPIFRVGLRFCRLVVRCLFYRRDLPFGLTRKSCHPE